MKILFYVVSVLNVRIQEKVADRMCGAGKFVKILRDNDCNLEIKKIQLKLYYVNVLLF